MRRREKSGHTVRDYCRAEGLRESAFYFWRRKLARRSQPSGAVSPPRPEATQVTPSPPGRVSPPRRNTPSFLPVHVVEHGEATTFTRTKRSPSLNRSHSSRIQEPIIRSVSRFRLNSFDVIGQRPLSPFLRAHRAVEARGFPPLSPSTGRCLGKSQIRPEHPRP